LANILNSNFDYMLTFEPIIKYEKGLIFTLLSQSFSGVSDEKLEEIMRQYDDEVFENPDTVGACAFITTFDNDVIGIASWDPRQGLEHGIIGWDCILPQFQGHGYGKAQMREVLRRLKQGNFKKAFVRTGEHPFFIRAQKMYLACGFQEIKRYPAGDQPNYGTIEYEITLIS